MVADKQAESACKQLQAIIFQIWKQIQLNVTFTYDIIYICDLKSPCYTKLAIIMEREPAIIHYS